MRHLVVGRRLSVTPSHRKAILRNLAQSLIEHGQIKTTLPKAKELVRFVEPLITQARKGTLHARRLVISRLNDRFMADPADRDMLADDTVVQKLFKEIGPHFKDRDGGYTRIIKTSEWRIGDGGDLVIVQLVGLGKVQAKAPAKKKGGKKKEEAPAA
ncbi:MAG: 50S ribosomal protein L17 [Phycisphaerales bacterium]|nr:50S ribosomal protein L17 [Phycisphaerales bacterium]